MVTANEVKKIAFSLSDKYYKLLLLVGASGNGKTSIINEICKDHAYKYVNLNLALSERLKGVSIIDRGYYLQDFIDNLIRDNPGDFLVLDNIEIIFSKHLQIEPLSLLQNIAKYRKTIAAWQGSIKDKYLTYAEPWHEDYVRYNIDKLECLYINMERSF